MEAEVGGGGRWRLVAEVGDGGRRRRLVAEVGGGGRRRVEADVRVRISCGVVVEVVVLQASGFTRGVSIPVFISLIHFYLFLVSE